MEIECPDCRRVIEFSREAPRFCSHCGRSLSQAGSSARLIDATSDATGAVGRVEETAALSASGQATAIAAKSLGEYRLLSELGRGGMGVVYQAEQAETGRRVALKLLSPSVQQSP